MAKCRNLVGAGMVQYPCTMEEHDGPCTAVEKPASKVQRAQWLASQADALPEIDMSDLPDDYTPPEILTMTQEPAPETPPVAEKPSVGVLVPEATSQPVEGVVSQFQDHDSRRSNAMETMSRDYDRLPPALQSWVIGASSQVALVELWRAFSLSTFVDAGGDKILVLSQEDIEQIVPEALRS